MGYAKVNYDDIFAASPINGTAASVVTGKKSYATQIDEIYHQSEMQKAQLLKAQAELKKWIDKTKGMKNRDSFLQPYRDKVTKLKAEREQFLAKYPFARQNQKELTGFIFEEVQKRLSQEQWAACVRQAQKNMEQLYMKKEIEQ